MSKYLADPMHGGFINFSEEKLEAWRAALFHAREVYFMWHLAEQHWVLVRLNKATKLCEIYEPSCLVKDKVIAQTILDAMNRLFDTDEYDEWCSVLYNSKAARIQLEGSTHPAPARWLLVWRLHVRHRTPPHLRLRAAEAATRRSSSRVALPHRDDALDGAPAGVGRTE